MSVTPNELSQMLARQVDAVVKHLLPDGKREGSEWRVGSVNGEPGKSMGVHLAGDKAGVWSDFSTGETGDLLDLWVAVQRCDMGQAVRQVKDYLGIREDDAKHLRQERKKTYKRPERPARAKKAKKHASQYLNGRGISDSTIEVYRVAEDGEMIIFPCLRGGELIMIKHLIDDRPKGGERKTWASKDSEPCLFGWQAIPAGARSVILTEGEIDCLSAYEYGYPAMSVPFGGGGGEKQRWIEYDWEALERFDTIYLAMDRDAEGREATNEIIKRLGRERCMIVELPSKDFNDCLQANIPPEDIAACFANAKSMDPEKLTNIDDHRLDVHDEFDNPPDAKGLSFPWDRARDLIRFRSGETTIWTGWNGHGKSQLLGFLAVSGMARDGVKFCIASMEMPARRTLSRMVRQAAATSSPTYEYRDHILDRFSETLWIYDQLGSADIDEMLVAFRYAAKRYGVTNFVVDSLAKLGLGEEDYDGQKRAINKITAFAHELGIHVHLVAHPRKGIDENRPPNKLDVRGGSALTDMADNVITIWRNKPKEQEADEMKGDPDIEPKHQKGGDVYLIVSKQRCNGQEGKVPLWFDPFSNQYLGGESHFPREIITWSIQEVAA